MSVPAQHETLLQKATGLFNSFGCAWVSSGAAAVFSAFALKFLGKI
jgi:hypothetical protein